MTTKKKINFQPFIIILSILIVYFILYLLFVINRANEADKSIFDSVGNFVGLTINAITIYFVFKTYSTNKRDVEFNRTIDLFYKQIVYSERKIENNALLKTEMDKFFLRTNDNTSLELEYVIIDNKELAKYAKVLRYITEDLQVYKTILNRGELKLEDRKFILTIAIENIYPDLNNRIEKFQVLFDNFKQSETYEIAKKEIEPKSSHSKYITYITEDIETYLKEIGNTK